MKKQELYFNNYRETIQRAIQNKQEIALYSIIPHNIVYKGKGDINEDVARANNFDIYNSIDFGGGIVATQGDMIFIIIQPEGWTVGADFIGLIIDFLKNSGLNAEQVDNDILIDGKYKVASYSSVNVGNRTIYTGIQVCFHADADLIRQICLKNSTKIPKGLADYNISQNEIMNIFNNFVK